MSAIIFKKEKKDLQFHLELKRRINQYFEKNNLTKNGNAFNLIKASVIFGVYVFCFYSYCTANSKMQLFLSGAFLGVSTIFLALNVAHDAAHHCFSNNKKLNKLFLRTFDFLGANGYIWQLKHVYSHHPNVNIPNMDGDIKQSNLVRIFPKADFKFFHKYQFIYMPFLYLLYTTIWLLFRDFKDFVNTNISGKQNVKHPAKEVVILILGKLFFIFRMIILPFLILDFSLKTILFAFFIFNLAASATVTLALISAHIGEDSVYPEPDENGKMEHSWVRHQLETTSDFACNSKILTHLFGGFNHHTVHHLFPRINHIHYPKLTEILKQTCTEFNMPYNSSKTLYNAIVSHFKFLKKRSKNLKPVPYIEM